jgi:DUF917 family protein
MGSMGLERRPGYTSRQVAIGGDPAHGRRLCLSVEGALQDVDALVRQAAVHAGGMVAVARNPVDVAYVRQHGAPGALHQAHTLGEAVLRTRSQGGVAVARAIAGSLDGQVVAQGPAREMQLETRGGFDIGRVSIADTELTFWNEYMTVDREGCRIATFPDLMATISVDEGLPVSTADLRDGREVVLLVVPRTRLVLGAGVRSAANLQAIERALGVCIEAYWQPRSTTNARSDDDSLNER